MEIIKHIKVPTGDILIVKGELGQLEMLSLGDYGKDVNIKANFLDLKRIPQQVKHQQLLSLTEKWVITISTQYGCSMGCNFCDVPKVGPGKNATFRDLTDQIITGIRLHPEIQSTKRLNIHFARMGEPTWNPNILDTAKWLKDHIDPEYKVHPVVSTMMPRKNIWLKTFIHNWVRIKNRLYVGNAGLQLSINSTNENERREMFNENACTLKEISQVMEGIIPTGRKITLNFAVGPYEINPEILLEHFNPRDFMVKLTPLHKTNVCLVSKLVTQGNYTTYEPYKDHEEKLRLAGYDVIVFIASEEEDLSRITCGNAILSGTLPFDTLEKINVK